MPFGEIFTGAFQRIWRHKSLWLLAMLGLALSAVSMVVSSLLASQWMGSYFDFIGAMMRNPGAMPGRALGNFMSSMSWMWISLALAGLLSLIGYIVNLVARGAIINEAVYAWRNDSTDAGRGLREGGRRAVHVFLLDLMWLLPGLLLGLGALIAFFVLLAGSMAVSAQNNSGGLIATSWLAFVCCGGCLALLYYLVFTIFSPLMYQSAVAGRRDFGGAVSEGWALARANVGAMIIFWLLLLVVGFVLSAIRGVFDVAVSLPLMSRWFQVMDSMTRGSGLSLMPAVQTLSGPAIVLLGLVSTVLWFLIASFTQTLNLTLYAGVYQHLTGIGPATPAYVNPLPVEPAPATPVSPPPEPLIVPPPALEDEPPPTL